jgi:hypothetical protein
MTVLRTDVKWKVGVGGETGYRIQLVRYSPEYNSSVHYSEHGIIFSHFRKNSYHYFIKFEIVVF